MKNFTINANTHPVLFNLLSLTEVADCDIVIEDDDGNTIHLGDLIESARAELLGE